MKPEGLTLLNAAILTCYGVFNYSPISLTRARALVREAKRVQSAVGHASTAEILSDLLDYPVSMNRMEYKQEAGEAALIFRLNQRPEEGKILSRKEIEEIGYEFGLLIRIE
jgi:hypothetical protein